MKTCIGPLIAATCLLSGMRALAVQFDLYLNSVAQQEIYTDLLFPNQAGMAWTSSGHLLLRENLTIHEYDPAVTATVHGTLVHQPQVAHPLSLGLGAGMTKGLDGQIYVLNNANYPKPVLQRFDPVFWTVQDLSSVTQRWGGWGITTLPNGQIAYVAASTGQNNLFEVRVFTPNINPALGTDVLLYTTTNLLIDDIESSDTGEIALAHPFNNLISIISSSLPQTLINTIPVPGGPDGLAFGASPTLRKLYSNNNDGTISEISFSGTGFTGAATVVPFAKTVSSHHAYGDLASVGPDCALYVSVGKNRTPAALVWDDGYIDTTDQAGAIIRISAAPKEDGAPGECLFTSVQNPHTECITFSNENIECLSSNTFQWSFCITNTGTFTIGHFVFPTLPPGVTVTPQIIDVVPPLLPGQGLCTNITVTLNGTASTNQLCFQVAAHVPDYSTCCVVTKCIKAPSCCAIVSGDTVHCQPGSPLINWTFNLQNLSAVPVAGFYIIPAASACASVSPNIVTLPTLLAPGASTTVTLPITVTSSPCSTACFRIVLHDTNFTACCSFVHCVSLTCKVPNTPPDVECASGQLICDPKGGQNVTITMGVHDADGDPLTVIWKIDGTSVSTTSIPGGSSLTWNPVHLMTSLSPGIHVVSVCVSDGNGAPTICSTTHEVGDHTPPKIVCPADQIVEGFTYVLPNMIPEIQVSDNCSTPNHIQIMQSPPPGTVLSAGHNCLIFTATDQAGNTATCQTCINVIPAHIILTGAKQGSFGIQTASEPADFVLAVEGVTNEIESVEYVSNGQSIGMGTGANFQLEYPKVSAGSYSIVANVASKRSPDQKAQIGPVFVFVSAAATPTEHTRFGSVTVQQGKLSLSIQTMSGERCVIEATDDLEGNSWKTVHQAIGNGQLQILNMDLQGKAKFYRIHLDQ